MAFEKFKGKKFSQIKAQADSKRKEPYKKIPAALRFGNKSKARGGFFDYDLILSASDKSIGSTLYDDEGIHVEEDEATGDLFVGVPDPVFKETMKSYFTDNLSVSASVQVSKSFFEQADGLGFAISQIPLSERRVGILVRPRETGSSDDSSATGIFPEPTASVRVSQSLGIGKTGGASRNRFLTLENTSSNFLSTTFKIAGAIYNSNQSASTAALVSAGKSDFTRSFDANGFHFVQPKPIRFTHFSSSHDAQNTTLISLSSSFSSSQDFGVIAGLPIALRSESILKYYNGVNSTDGHYHYGNFKGFVAGDGFSGEDEVSQSLKSFLTLKEYVYYGRGIGDTSVRSASFHFYPYPDDMEFSTNIHSRTAVNVRAAGNSARQLFTSSLVTLYWQKHSYTGSYLADFGFKTKEQLASNVSLGGGNYQLPYLPAMSTGSSPLTITGSTPGKNFGTDNVHQSGSHVWYDAQLSIPAKEGYYIHSSSVALSASSGHASHSAWATGMTNIASSINSGVATPAFSGSLIVYGVFKNVVDTNATSRALLNNSSSQHRDNMTKAFTINECPRVARIFLANDFPIGPYRSFNLFPYVKETSLTE